MELYGRDVNGAIVNPYVAGTIVVPGLVDSVYTLTARPDLVDETLNAVVGATLMLHGMDFWYKDVISAQIVFEQSAYVQVLDVQDLPRYRNIAYLRKNDPTLSAYQQNPTLLPPITTSIDGVPITTSRRLDFLKILTPEEILDSYGAEKLDVAYQAGTAINIKSSSPLQYVLGGWYAFPIVDTRNNGALFESFIARDFPYAIIYHAASQIYQMIGQLDTSRKYDSPAVRGSEGGLVQQQINNIRISNTVAEGY